MTWASEPRQSKQHLPVSPHAPQTQSPPCTPSIGAQVENGKGAMPAWDGTLDDEEIAAVAEYVFKQVRKQRY